MLRSFFLLNTVQKVSYLLVMVTLMLSGNPAFTLISKQVDLLLFSFVLIILMFLKKTTFTNKFLIVLVVFIFIFIAQSIRDQSLIIFTELGVVTILFIAFSIQNLVINFPKVYVNIIFYLGIMSFIFYVPAQLFGESFREFFQWARADLGSYMFHIHVHNFRIATDDWGLGQTWRNAGVFWEPAAYGGYLILGLLLLSIIKNEFTRQEYLKRFWVILVSLLSTCSTSSYLVLFIVIIFFYAISDDDSLSVLVKKNMKLVLGMVVLVPLIMQLPFMSDKLSDKMDFSNASQDEFAKSRMGGFTFDAGFIKEKPLVGWGADPSVRWKETTVDEDILKGQGNGLTGYIVKFGFIGFFIYLLALYHSLYTLGLTRLKCFAFISCIILLLVGEQFLNFALFLSLMFIRTKLISSNEAQKSPDKILGFGNK